MCASQYSRHWQQQPPSPMASANLPYCGTRGGQGTGVDVNGRWRRVPCKHVQASAALYKPAAPYLARVAEPATQAGARAGQAACRARRKGHTVRTQRAQAAAPPPSAPLPPVPLARQSRRPTAVPCEFAALLLKGAAPEAGQRRADSSPSPRAALTAQARGPLLPLPDWRVSRGSARRWVDRWGGRGRVHGWLCACRQQHNVLMGQDSEN